MTLQEIGERLKAEFPDIFVSFDAQVHWHGSAGSTKAIDVEMTLYTEATGLISGFATLREGIIMLKRKLGMLPSGEGFDIDVEVKVEAEI